jgi:hypothetical protein
VNDYNLILRCVWHFDSVSKQWLNKPCWLHHPLSLTCTTAASEAMPTELAVDEWLSAALAATTAHSAAAAAGCGRHSFPAAAGEGGGGRRFLAAALGICLWDTERKPRKGRYSLWAVECAIWGNLNKVKMHVYRRYYTCKTCRWFLSYTTLNCARKDKIKVCWLW